MATYTAAIEHTTNGRPQRVRLASGLDTITLAATTPAAAKAEALAAVRADTAARRFCNRFANTAIVIRNDRGGRPIRVGERV